VTRTPRWLVPLLVLASVVAVGVVVVLPSADQGRSTLSRGPDGTAALAEVLRGRGHRVESLRLGLHVLRSAEPGSVLVVLAGTSVFSVGHGDAEVQRMREFLEQGSTVVLFTDRSHALATDLDVEVEDRALPRGTLDDGLVHASPAVAHPGTAGGSLAMRSRSALEGAFGLPLFASGDRVVAASTAVGKGRVLVFADPFLPTNAGLGRAGNLAAVMAATAGSLQGEGAVLFDDLHAGAADAHGTLAYARRAGLAPAVLLAVLALGLFGWRASRREGAILADLPGGPDQASSELVRALAALYERAELTDHALDIVSRRFRRELEARAGVSWKGKRMRAWVAAELGPAAAREFDDLSRRFTEAYRIGSPSLDRVGDLADRVHRFRTDRLHQRRAGNQGRDK